MLPINLRPNGRHAVVVGGGPVAARKAAALAEAGFRLVVVAPAIVPELRALLERRDGELRARAYRESDGNGAVLIVAATDDETVNARIVENARAGGTLVCDAAHPGRGDVVMPAVERVGPMTIAVESGVPAFSKRIAAELAATLEPHHARAAARLRQIRRQVKALVPLPQRASVMRAIAALPAAELAAMADDDAARAVANAIAGRGRA